MSAFPLRLTHRGAVLSMAMACAVVASIGFGQSQPATAPSHPVPAPAVLAPAPKLMIDYFLPTPIISPLTKDVWGNPSVLPRDEDNGLESHGKMAKFCYWDGQILRAPDGKYQTYDLAMWDWVPPVDPDFMLSVMTCAAWGNNSDSGYCNKEYDALYAKQSTLLDPKARKTVVDKMQQIVYDDRPYVVLNYPNIIEAHSKAWTGFVMSPEVGSVTNLSMETLLNVHRVN